MGATEPFKKWRRSVDFHSISLSEKCRRWYGRLSPLSRKILIIFIFIGAVFLYISPSLSFISSDEPLSTEELLQKCIDEHVHQMYYKRGIIDEFVFYKDEAWSEITYSNDNKYSPMVGNGLFGVSFHPKPILYIKDGRTLNLSTEWSPLQPIYTGDPVRQVYFTNVFKGTVNHFQCVKNGLRISSSYVAHRTNPHLFYQDIIFSNPTDHELLVNLDKIKFPGWSSLHIADTRTDGLLSEKPLTFSGIVKNNSNHESIAVCVSMKGMSSSIEVPPHRTKHFTFPVIILKETFNFEQFTNGRLQVGFESKCLNHMKSLAKYGSLKWDQDHSFAWNKLWNTGLTISHSKASGALNTDHINATVYYVLSNVVMDRSQTKIDLLKPVNFSNYASVAEGCFGGYHHTLQLARLWGELRTYKMINETVNLWLLTLEKQGCPILLWTGAEGVAQAMILSFGGFRFSLHHLEFKIEPKFLHRDYNFRNILIDFNTHINVSVILQENNKAILAVSIDKTSRDYWACDGGCIDEPVKLSSEESIFPVKITEPATSILYITPDRSHIELITDTLHVHKIVEAPAHDQLVVALHKHGSHLGGLPILFWATVITLIIIFHLFLCKLVYNEYSAKQDKGKGRYTRVAHNRGV